MPEFKSTNASVSTTSTTLNNLTIPKQSTEANAFHSILAGGIGGALMVTVGHPLDLIKVRSQAITTHTTPKLGIFTTLKNVVKIDGPKGLYRGLLTPLVTVTPIFALEYGAFEYFMKLMRIHYNMQPKDSLSTLQVGIAGGLSSVPAAIIVTPSERIKCMIQANKVSLTQAINQVGGLRGLYQGTLATLARDIPGAAAYFATYSVLKKEISTRMKGDGPNPFAIMVAGGLAGMANWIFAIPADVIKSRQQIGRLGQGFTETAQHLIQTEGVKGLFKGLWPALVRAFPANAACFLGVEATFHLLGIQH